jgi:mRNA-degrading endonuclease toxin of MazEF toxin-antitoxin module
VVWVEVPDPRGQNRKRRPAVLLTAPAAVPPGQPLVAVAVTSQVDGQPGPEFVLLPYHSDGHPQTGLRKRCAAVCRWLVTFAEQAIQDVAGVVPPAVLSVIKQRLPPLPGNEPGGRGIG